MSKHIIVTCCGDCPYNDAPIDNKSWYCMEPTQLDSYGVGTRLGDRSRETLSNMPNWCPLENYNE